MSVPDNEAPCSAVKPQPHGMGMRSCRLFVVLGCYWALLKWAGVTPLQNGRMAWSGQFNNQASITGIVAYVAANGVSGGLILPPSDLHGTSSMQSQTLYPNE